MHNPLTRMLPGLKFRQFSDVSQLAPRAVLLVLRLKHLGPSPKPQQDPPPQHSLFALQRLDDSPSGIEFLMHRFRRRFYLPDLAAENP